jgi:5'-3' exoribonuclease 1
MIRVLEQYKQRFSWVWTAIEKQETSQSGGGAGGKSGPPQALTLEELFPGMDNEAALAQVSSLRKWLKSTPLARRPLVKPTAKVAPESAVRMLQAALPPNISKTVPAVELENVAPALLMAPLMKGGVASAFAGGNFEIGDRVLTVSSVGAPAFGSRGTVVGVYDEAVEVLFDQEFLGGNDLFGRCNGNYGAMLPADQILNLSRPHAVRAEGAAAFKMVRRESGGTAEATGNSNAASTPMSAAQALAAASAALQGKGAPKPPSGPEPRIPDKAGSKGFAWGTGRGVPVGIKAAAAGKIQAPLPPPPPPALAPGSQPSGNAGAELLAQLNRSSVAAAPGQRPVSPSPPMNSPQGIPSMPPPPPSHLMMMMPPPPPGGPYPPYPPHPGMMHPPPYPMPIPMPPHAGMMYPGGPPPPSHPIHNQGNDLLAQLQRGGASGPGTGGQQQQQPPPNPGSALLSQLQGKKEQPQPHPVPHSPPNAGNLLLQQLQKSPTSTGTAAAAKAGEKPPAAARGDGNFEAMWKRMQQQGDKVAAAAAPPAAAEADAIVDDPPPPPAPSAAMLIGAGGSSAADAFWDMMTNPAAGGGNKKGGNKKK